MNFQIGKNFNHSKKSKIIRLTVLLFLCNLLAFQLQAVELIQPITITGTVIDEFGGALPGVNIQVKGTMTGTVSDAEGRYTIQVPSTSAVLMFSFIGYATQEIAVGNQRIIDVKLNEDTQQIAEVVVTALGIKREKKALGYAMQELKGDQLVEARENNLANALTGKVSGLQVIRSSNGPAGSSKIVLRGNKSLSGSNQPLIVVDGVPMNNFTGGVSDIWGNSGTDTGSGIADINPEDIESMTVLKGGSAAALYGSRAGNGVILITTKSGRVQQGVGITVSAGINISSMFVTPDLQDNFAQGTANVYNKNDRMSWGPKITGQSEERWDGQTVKLQTYGNIGNFFRTGITTNENVSFQQMVGETSVFASVNRMDDAGMIPNTEMNKTSFLVRTTTPLGNNKKWLLDVKANYIRHHAENRPLQGMNPANPYLAVQETPRSLDLEQLKDPMVDENGKMIWYEAGSSPNENPWWVTENRLSEDNRNRFLGTMSLTYSFTDWLDTEIKAGTDYYTTTSTGKVYAGGTVAPNGSYSERFDSFYENNYSFLVTAHQDNLIDRFGGFVTLGGNLMDQVTTYLSANAGNLNNPNVFNINNGVDPVTADYKRTPQKINSLYGSLQLNWDAYLFLDFTLRNDWSSTMSKDNRSFSYPSVSFSGVVSDMVHKLGGKLPSWITFIKLRASYAEVGNSLEPFNLYNSYTLAKDPLSHVTAYPNTVLYSEDVVNELIKSKEIGLDLRFFQGRLAIDAAWYRNNTTNQLMNIPLDPFSGYASKKINAGNIQNQGWEFMVTGDILENPNSLNWTVTANFSTNKDKIISLTPDVALYNIQTFDAVQIVAKEGSDYGDIYGRVIERVDDPNSPYNGMMIVDGAGLPVISADRQYAGNQQARGLLGVTNSFAYKGFNFSFLVDARFGGKIYSGTSSILTEWGNAAETVSGGDRQDFVVPNSVRQDGSNYVVNNVSVRPENYWTRVTGGAGNLGVADIFAYNATNVRLRNITLGYQFGNKMLAGTPFTKLSISASCNNVWMIWYDLPGIDPESVLATNTNAVGLEMGAMPTPRVFSFNITLGF